MRDCLGKVSRVQIYLPASLMMTRGPIRGRKKFLPIRSESLPGLHVLDDQGPVGRVLDHNGVPGVTKLSDILVQQR